MERPAQCQRSPEIIDHNSQDLRLRRRIQVRQKKGAWKAASEPLLLRFQNIYCESALIEDD